MRIVIIGDSLAMARETEKILLEDTYGYLLKIFLETKSHTDVFIMARRSNDTSIQSADDHLLYDIKQFLPDIVIIQIGIVDCAPRIFGKIERNIIAHLPASFSAKVINFCSKRRLFLTKYFPKVYVNIKDFETNMRKILDAIKEIKAIPMIVNIAKPGPEILSRSYNSLQNVTDYNEVHHRLCAEYNAEYVDAFNITENDKHCLLNDGMHFSKYGHKKLADILFERIETFYYKNRVNNDIIIQNKN